MKIALLGYGKMGQTIEKIAVSRGHEIVVKVDENTKEYDITLADVAIDFSIPSVAVNNISNCFNNGVPVVSGTTGWLADYDKMVNLCNEKNGGFIYASNYSLGVNIFFELNQHLAKMMKNLSQYDVTMEEIHHKQKLDEPSGTAITLAEGVIEHTKYNGWEVDKATEELNIPIKAIRSPEVPGTHTVDYTSEVDSIEIKHTAHNRQGFALGAVIAAEWLVGKHGVFSMRDVLGL
ncbi:4-hydroxy-tetrahydrodipicolinate reductase [Wenyingzhuangia marina]|uniref:4-hydroxy-tetrahydrodipicolinate reductase n=1 Tax=Wenyingzhuangia marina TaxID=1195760 RepID=A0A1M5VVM4_9FLAO|nr:4-hydroxy-tetrahydrodipicolinate reductase [Wenyingzhuangia marina]GGF77726.1 4-hydroxy-tetrahydrodipicolinate reductase [Wenyingzhuangia marina]SHH78993.1 dihydrodipicolinate reductase [Wenyingzhuangia marina]